MTTRILMVGSGAVGQVLGLFLARSGIDLCFYARPGSAERLRQALDHGGLPLFQTSHRRRRDPVVHRLSPYRVVTDVAGSRHFAPDQIWFATPSTVYYSQWFRTFLHEVPSKRVVCFAPEGGRPELVPEGESPDRLVFGGITFIAWQGDLGGGGGHPESVNFWLPPGLTLPVMGTATACREVAAVLDAAGLRSAVKPPDYRRAQASVTALMSTFAAGVELSGWSLGAFRAGPWLRPTARGAREGILSQLGHVNVLMKGLLGIPLSPPGLFLITLALPLLFPFDLERYLAFHYQKTGEQTLALLDLFVDDGRQLGLPVDTLRRLRQGLLNAR